MSSSLNDETTSTASSSPHDQPRQGNLNLVLSAVALSSLMAQLGSCSLEQLEKDCRWFAKKTVVAVIELGKRLLLIKTLVDHGQWMDTLKRIGIGQSLANKAMRVTIRLINAGGLPILLDSVNSQGQLFELMILDDDELKQLDNYETVRDVSQRTLRTMTVKQLRKTLKENAPDKTASQWNSKSTLPFSESPAQPPANADSNPQFPAMPPEVAPILGERPESNRATSPDLDAGKCIDADAFATSETYPAVYAMRPGKFNGCELSILEHEGRAWLMAEEIIAVLADTPEEEAAVEERIQHVCSLNTGSTGDHYTKVQFASSSLIARIFDSWAVHCLCTLITSELASEFDQWFSGQCAAVQPVNKPEAKPEEPQRADYLEQLRGLHYELYDAKCLIASQIKAIQVVSDDLQEEKVYPVVDLAKIAFRLTEQLDTLLDRHDSLLTDFGIRLFKKPGADDTMPESVWLGLVDELSADREVWDNEDMWRLSQHADCLSRYAGRSPEAAVAIRHLKAFVARKGAILYDHLYEGEQPGEGRIAFTWQKGVQRQRQQKVCESVLAH